MAFQTIKTSFLKSGKICIFTKGLLHRFRKKFLNFLFFFYFRQNKQGKCLTIFLIEKKPIQIITKSILKTRKIDFFLKELVHGFGQKFEIFLLFILAKIGMEKVFDDIFHSKKGFLENIDFDFKKSKNCVFPTDLVHA